ncbi:MAG: site-specific integrase [Bacteroidia bacterium]|nr:site-specific integrase [Bacteroidia bacterium]
MRFKYTIVLDKRRKLQSGKYPIKVNIHSYADNKNHYVSIPSLFTKNGKLEFSCENQKEFDSVWTNRHKKDSFGNVIGETTVYGEKLELRNALKIQNDRLIALMEDTSLLTLAEVKDWIKNWDAKEYEIDKTFTNLWFAFAEYITKLNEEERYKYATSMGSTIKKLTEFVGIESNLQKLRIYRDVADLSITDIDVDFMNAFEAFMFKQGRSKATVGVYARNIRTIWNDLYESHSKYPFGKGGYVIPEGARKNQGLSKADIKKIVDFSSDNEYLQTARDYFLFCFYNGGMNIKDVLHLKKGQKEFKRLKSIRTAKKEVIIPLVFNKITNDIIDRRTGKGSYLFDVIKDGDDAKTRQNKVDALNRALRPQLHKLSDLLELEYKITPNWSRHSSTTILFEEGISLKAISEGLGHTTLNQTEGYINTMIDKERPKIEKALSFDEDDSEK